jgi:dTDP-4-amino-4,6-dideoxygalactose transaminase
MNNSNNKLIPFVNLGVEFQQNESEYVDALRKIGLSGNYILGQNVLSFEKNISDLIDIKHVISVGNGSDAIVFILKALGIGPGDEVITPPNSFIASTWSIIAVGAKPIFCDIDETLNIDPLALSKYITKKTKAILAVHFAGVPCKIDLLQDFCKQNSILLIEDCAQSIGSIYKNKHTGTFGIAGAFSLHPLKSLGGMGDGGFISTNNEDLANQVRLMRNHGLSNRDSAEIWGFNSRLDEIQAAFLNIKLNNFASNKARTKKIGNYFLDNLCTDIELPIMDLDMDVYWHRFIIFSRTRDLLKNKLREMGIDTRIHYPIPIHLQNSSKNLGYKLGDFPNTERQSNFSLSIPLYPQLTDLEVEYIVEKVNDISKKGQ